MEAQLHDGTILEFPDGTDPSVIRATVKKTLASRAAPDTRSLHSTATPKPSWFDNVVRETQQNIDDATNSKFGSAGRAFLHNAGKVVAAPVELGAYLGGKAVGLLRPDLDTGKQPVSTWLRQNEDRYQREVPDSLVTNAAGAAGAIVPFTGGPLKQGLSKAYEIGRKPVVDALVKNHPTLAKYLGAITGGAVTGGAVTPFVPVGTDEGDYAEKKARQFGTNVALGGAIPAVAGPLMHGAQSAKDFIYPSVGRLGLRAAGDKADDVIAALKSTKSDTPGVNLTTGQASVPANSAEFAAFQNAAAIENPSKFYGPSGIKGQQESARVAAVRSFGKTSKDLETAVTARSAVSAKNYGDAWATQIKGDPELARLFKNPYVKDAVPEALKLAQANGISPKSDLTQFLHFVKEGLDAKLQTANNPNMPAISNAAKGAVTDAKSTLVSWLGKKNPEYDSARLRHIADSIPINQMRIGQDLERALVAPATGGERAASFGSKVRQAETTISKGSGRPQIEALNAGQRKAIDAITQDFVRNQQFKDLASAGTKGMQERIGAPTVPPTGIFQPMISAARSWVNKGLGTGHEQALRRAAEVMGNPQEMARLMEAASPAQRKVIQAILLNPGATIGTAAQYVGSNKP